MTSKKMQLAASAAVTASSACRFSARIITQKKKKQTKARGTTVKHLYGLFLIFLILLGVVLYRLVSRGSLDCLFEHPQRSVCWWASTYLWNVRQRLNFGSPYRHGPKTRGRRPQLETMDILGLSLWYLKKCDLICVTCPLFGIIPSTVEVWPDYSLEIFVSDCSKPHLFLFLYNVAECHRNGRKRFSASSQSR